MHKIARILSFIIFVCSYWNATTWNATGIVFNISFALVRFTSDLPPPFFWFSYKAVDIVAHYDLIRSLPENRTEQKIEQLELKWKQQLHAPLTTHICFTFDSVHLTYISFKWPLLLLCSILVFGIISFAAAPLNWILVAFRFGFFINIYNAHMDSISSSFKWMLLHFAASKNKHR